MKTLTRFFALVAVLCLAATSLQAISSNQNVTVTSSGRGTKSYVDPSGWWQTINYTCVVSLAVSPYNPTDVGNVFESTSADIQGSIRFMAHAEDHYFGSVTIEDYDVTKNYTVAAGLAYADFRKSDRSVSWVGAPLPYSTSSSKPWIYGIKFDGSTGVLTNLIQLSSFWYFNNYYPVYASAVSTNKPRLVVIVHGWKGSASDWPNDMRDAIGAQLTNRFQARQIPVSTLSWNENDTQLTHGSTLPTGWEVVALNWPQRANTLFPQGAQRNGGVLGGWFGTLVQKFDYESIHVIGHSAGSWVIDSITDTVKKLDTGAGRTTDIHATFLDAYAQGSTYCLLGDHADWAEQYVANGTFGTDWTLPWAFNLDLNSILPSGVGDHSWPWMWYQATTTNPLAPLYKGTVVGPYGWGFMQTVEYADHHPTFSNWRQGDRVDLKTGQEIQWRPKVNQQQLDLPIDPRQLTMSNPAKVTDVSSTGFTLITGSPTWVSMPVTVPAGFDLIRFNYQFLSSAHGTFDLAVEGTNVLEALEDYSSGLQDSGWLLLADDPSKTNFVVTATIDPAGGPTSSIRVSNFQVGQMQATNVTPTLAITSAGGQLKIRWPRWFNLMQLQTAQTLNGSWTQVAGQPQLDGDWLFISPSPSLQSQFFRLTQ